MQRRQIWQTWFSWGLLILLSLLLLGCEPESPENRTLAVLSQQNDAGFEQVKPGQPLIFPQDHLSHPGFRVEWWYLTANLTSESGQWLAVQWTLFRTSARPNQSDVLATGWQSPQRFMAHAVVTTAEKRWQAERFARGGIGQSGVTAEPFTLWLDNWRWQGQGGSPFPGTLTFRDQQMDVTLKMRSYGNRVLQGDGGYSQKDPADPRLASYYYSMPFLSVDGEIRLDGVLYQVKGEGWFDREWSSQSLSEHQQGWDWFSIHLDDGRALMLYQLRSHQHPAYTFGSLSWPDGKSIPITQGQASLTPIRMAKLRTAIQASDIQAEREFPVRWHLVVPEQQIELDVQARRDDQLLPFLFPYWEGPVTVTGSHTGQGFMELTGY
ncbi:lipocalin-like domain-containing protein [Photobacterium galatheae]|uniref:ABC transporter n=1 Tax=Photobacterium galatheae TaxID=1654360 RepID=A0A066RUY2_9GAMM|nr:lipocalin-like domain-containing protein [Photobacterium galatheae]KDM91522.1 ABC transporter [Photobacterium galatheae]MCM0149595.1 carotenoid 1,2-hydratase [Photobacterium galatheae]